METNNPNISENDHSSILNHIINCANCALQNKDAFQKAMLGLATELRNIFDSEYCSIGIVSDGYAEDCVISLEKFEDEELSKQQQIFLDSVKRASIDDDKCTVCLALKSSDHIYRYIQEKLNELNNYKYYQHILTSRSINNSCVIPIRDLKGKSYGFIQFINTEKGIDYERDIQPYRAALLGLVQVIINNQKNQQELVRKDNRLKDAEFYDLMQEKKDDVDELLDSIMGYFSKQFNAAVISFRIPVLNGYKKVPLFYLRRVFVDPSIEKQNELINRYYSGRLVKNREEMQVANELRCDDQGKILDSNSDTDFSQYGLDLDKNTLIMPIIRDIDKKCIHPQKEDHLFCKVKEHHNCIYRFKRFYGFFRLRISKTNLNHNENKYSLDYNETKERLAYLSKQITLLLNSIVDKHENESLKIFQNELKNSSFIKIQNFDKQCVEIIKNSIHAKVCSIYRFNNRAKQLSLSATTSEIIQFEADKRILYFAPQQIQESCFISTKATNNLLTEVYNGPRSLYVFNILDSQVHQSPFIEIAKSDAFKESALAVPMMKKDGNCAGVVLLLGKEEHKHSISTAYWEHDIKHVEFIVDILTRISESDTERLTFLSQLSHELLSPVTEQVYDNDFTVGIAERNSNSLTKQQLISKLYENLNRNMLFKYIITDTEFIYSSGSNSVDYNIALQNKPREILLDAIRLMEKEAHAKTLSIRTLIAQMPPMYFDKERMMQVFLNLLKNAIRYSNNYSTIKISYNRAENDFHEICFENQGIGVKEEEKESIFELFHRGEEAKKRTDRGTGMGLYIVRDIMRAHNGDCFVRRLHEPTEFVITIPNKIKTN